MAYTDGQLFVKIKRDSNYKLTIESKELQALVEEFGIQKIHKPFILDNPDLQQTYLVEFPGTINPDSVISGLTRLSFIDYAERVPSYEIFYTPDDLLSQQWHLPAISAEQAWNITTGNPDIIIAIVDDAVLLTHEDIFPSLWINPGEINNNGLDDDGNGYIDDINGWDVASNDNDPNPVNPTNSYFSHGTYCAGIAAASTDNNTGIASIGFNTGIMAVKCAINGNGQLTASYLGVQYAIASGADIISMSWGGPGFSQTYQNLFDFAFNKGIICVAAAGNSNTNIPMYPAAYNNVISVGATDSTDAKSSFSNFGAWIDVMAPGTSIWCSTAGSDSSYAYKSGTSMACPLVSGLAALMLSKDSLLSPAELLICIKSGCDTIDAQNPNYIGQIGAGRINALNALTCIKPLHAKFTSDAIRICPGDSVLFTDLSYSNPVSWQWDFQGGSPPASTTQNPTITYPAAGIYQVKLVVSDGLGFDSVIYNNYITVATPSATLPYSSFIIIEGASTNLKVDLSGNPPWTISYSDGFSTSTITNIQSSPYYINVSPVDTTTYTLISVNDNTCAGTVNGNTTIFTMEGNTPLQSDTCEVIRFHKTYTAGTEAHSVRQTPDGGFIVAGNKSNDFCLIKTNANGDVQWQKSYGGTSFEHCETVACTFDGGYIMVGYTTSFGAGSEDGLIVKVDSTGAVQWAKTVGEASAERVWGVQQTSDGGYIITGHPSVPFLSAQVYLMKLDAMGNALWVKHYGGPSWDSGAFVEETTDGGYIVYGATDSYGQGSYDVYMIKTNNAGDTLWTRTYGGTGLDVEGSGTQTSDGGYIVNGYTQSFGAGGYDIYLIKTNASGDTLWTKAYGGPLDDKGYFVQETYDGGYILTGRTKSFGGGNDDIFLIRTDEYGDTLWCMAYGSSGTEQGYTVYQTIDGGFIAAGVAGSSFHLIKTDAKGKSGCNEYPANFVVSQTNTGIKYGGTVNLSSPTFTDPSLIVSVPSNTTSVLCNDTIDDLCPAAVTANCKLYADFYFQVGCIGDSTYFNDQSVDSINNIVNWKWYFGDGDSLIGILNPGHAYLVTDTFNVTLIVSNDTVPTCLDTITRQVIVVDNLTVIAPADSSICEGDSISLKNLYLSCGAPPYSYLWQPSSGLNSDTIPNPVASPQATTTYYITVTDSLGMTAADSLTVFVNPNCCTSHAVINADNNFCSGDSVYFLNNSLAKPGADYFWEFGINAIPSFFQGSTPPGIFFDTNGIFPVTLIVEDSCGADTAYHTVNIFPLPGAFAGNDTAFCAPGSVEIGSPFVSQHNYLWTPSAGLSNDTISNPMVLFQGTYTLKETDMITGCFAVDSVTITVNQLIIIYTAVTICNNDSIFLSGGWQDSNGTYYDTLTSVAGCDSIIISTLSVSSEYIISQSFSICDNDSIFLGGEWQDSSGTYYDTLASGPGCDTIIESTLNVATVHSINQSYSICDNDSIFLQGNYQTAAGIYNDTLASVNGCDSIISTVLSVFPEPVVNVSPGYVTIYLGDNVTFSASIPDSTSFLWSPPDFLSCVNCLSPVANPDSSATYYLTVTNVYNCSFTDSVIVTVEYLPNGVFIPNIFSPNGDGKNDMIFVHGSHIDKLELFIYDRWGEKVFETFSKDLGWDGTYKGKRLNSAIFVYYLNVTFADGTEFHKHGNITLIR